ncbi:trehalose-6-phosphate hydrolase [Enterococcus sp. AZ194]|uniref:alpha-amylase family glycosyl hydrolase n=1 Tax=Enterococcus sp. AZ194 TaxID=2774629 RepID=UPI003F20540A
MWWENAVFYEIYIASFADSNGDGFGDIEGIREKIPYLKECGVEALWLTPFYPSPRVDNGYDVSDYCAVDSQYGTIEHFKLFLEEAHRNQLKVIIDVVFNHTSTEHPWFIESASSKNNPKRDWYIWRDQPTNWESFFGGSAWQLETVTNQYYYHSFAKEQADLNWQNPEVKQAIFEVLLFWLDLGVDGFRFDVINNLTVDNQFRDNPNEETGEQQHLYDVNQPGIQSVLKEMIQQIKEIKSDIFTVAEISSDSLPIISEYTRDGLFDTAFNFNLGSIEQLDLKKLTNEFKKMTEQKGRPTFFFNSHDMSRSWNRLAKEDSQVYQLLAVFMLINRGIPFLFQGEEQGALDYLPQSIKDVRDVQAKNKYQQLLSSMDEEQALIQANQVNRDRSRGMLTWSAKSDMGWIGQSPKNPEGEQILAVYQQLIQLRKSEGPFGTVTGITLENECLSYRVDKLQIVLNFGQQTTEQIFEDAAQTIFGTGRVSSNGQSVSVPPKSCWIGKDNG